MRLDVSVVVPTYNRAGLIGETLRSILAQTLPPREVIVVDDGSTDDTESVVRQFGPVVRYVRIDHSCPANARKVGISLARCDWIALCDSDDLWLPEKLELQARLVEEAPGVEYCFTDFWLLRPQGRDSLSKFQQAPPGFWKGVQVLSSADLWIFSEPIFPRILKFQPIFPSSLLFSKRFYEAVGGFRPEVVGNIPAEDLEFTLRCTLTAPLGAVAKPVVEIRKHPASHSADTLGVLQGEIYILEYARSSYSLPLHLLRQIEAQISMRSAAAAALAFARGELSLVRQLEPRVARVDRDPKLRLKFAVAKLPTFLGLPLARLLVLLRSATARRRATASNVFPTAET